MKVHSLPVHGKEKAPKRVRGFWELRLSVLA